MGAIVGLVIIGVGVGVAVTLLGAPTTISTGTGTATITWEPVSTNADTVSTSPQPFEGSIEGITASGVATMFLSAAGASSTSPRGTTPPKLEVAQWKGTFGGKPFDLNIFAQYSSNAGRASPTAVFPIVSIVGPWGTELVNGRINAPTAAELKSGTAPLHFHGTVGDFQASGTVNQPTGNKKKQSLATFTVTK